MIPVKNPCVLIPKTGEDYSLVVYFLSETECQVIIHRLDKAEGWIGLTLKIDEVEIQVPDSSTQTLEFKVCTTHKLEKVDLDYIQKIPKIIMQTDEKEECNDPCLLATRCTLRELNPEYTYEFFDDKTRRAFIKENAGESILEAYDTIIPGAFKADLFRYCFLYKKGGCYFDHKIILRKPLREVIKPDDTFLVCADYCRNNSLDVKVVDSYLNSIIFTEAGNPIMLTLIEKCVENILKNQAFFLKASQEGDREILSVTGPRLFYSVAYGKIPDSFIRFKHIIKDHDESKYTNFQILDMQGGLFCTKTYKTTTSPDHYSILWKRGELFMRNRRTLGEYTVYVYPHPFPDVFEFTIQDGILTVFREAGGWWLDLRVKIISESGESVSLLVGRGSGTKQVILPKGFGESVKTVVPAKRILPKVTYTNNIFLESTVKPEDINVKEVVIAITSIIRVSSAVMGQGEARSAISPRDRYLQTIEQIDTVRSHVPDATIILLEQSVMLEGNELKNLSEACDYVIRFDSPSTLLYCHTHQNKSLGEMHVLSFLGGLIENKNFKWFCKLNGRYKLRPEFDMSKFLQPFPVANCIKGNGRLGILAQTVFYCVPKRFFKLYKEHFLAWLSADTTEPVEHIFTMFLESVREIRMVGSLGVEGIGGLHGNRIVL